MMAKTSPTERALFLPLLHPSGGEGRGEEAPAPLSKGNLRSSHYAVAAATAKHEEMGGPLSPALSPLVPRGEREKICAAERFMVSRTITAHHSPSARLPNYRHDETNL